VCFVYFRFSPSGQYLAVGSEEGTVDFYDLSKGASLQRAGFCKGISGFITSVDFSPDSKYARVMFLLLLINYLEFFSVSN